MIPYHYVPLAVTIPRWLDDILMWPSYWIYLVTGHALDTSVVLLAVFLLVGLLPLVALLRTLVRSGDDHREEHEWPLG